MNETELLIEVEQVRAENRLLRHQLDNACDEALRMRHVVERFLTLSHMALHAGTGVGVGEAGATGAEDQYGPF